METKKEFIGFHGTKYVSIRRRGGGGGEGEF